MGDAMFVARSVVTFYNLHMFSESCDAASSSTMTSTARARSTQTGTIRSGKALMMAGVATGR